jgi:hypothetical protein
MAIWTCEFPACQAGLSADKGRHVIPLNIINFNHMRFKIKLTIVELEDDNFHLVALSAFNEGQPHYWIIDTGASKTVFDLNLKNYYESAEEETDQVHTAGIGDKPIHTAIGNLHSFSMGKLKIENLRVALLDLSHINTFYSQAANFSICGLLGGDFLKKYNAVLDYKRKIMILETKR